MLAQQNAGFGLSGLAKTAEAAATAQGVGQGAQFGASALKGLDTGLDFLAGTGKFAGVPTVGMGLLSGGQPPAPPPPRPQPVQSQPLPNIGGYGGGEMPPELMGLPPNHPAVIQWKMSQGRMS